MIISNHVHAAAGAYASQQPRANVPRPAAAGVSNAGEFVLSQTGQDFSAMLCRAKENSSAVRMDRVAALERQIASGTYHVDAESLAKSLLAMRY